MLARPVAVSQAVVLVVGSSLSERDRALTTLSEMLFIGGPVLLLLTCVAGYGVAAWALALVVSLSSSEARAQNGSVAAGPDPSTVKDVEDLKSAKHELEVARHYFHNKKAYLASYKRAD